MPTTKKTSTKSSDIGFGIIGCGVIAPTHREAIKSAPGAKLVACCDIVLDKAKKFADDSGAGVKAYRNIEDMLNQDNVEAVCVCVPSGLHGDVAILALEAGKHVLCEKPMAPTVDQCLALCEACEQANVTLMIAQKKRFTPAAAFLKEHVGGDFGKPVSLNYRYHPGQVPKHWFWQEDDGGRRGRVGRIRRLRGSGRGCRSAAGGDLHAKVALEERLHLAGITAGGIHIAGGDAAEEGGCLLYTSDAADDLLCVDLGGRRIIKKKK